MPTCLPTLADDSAGSVRKETDPEREEGVGDGADSTEASESQQPPASTPAALGTRKIIDEEARTQVLSMLSRLSDQVVLGEEVKSLSVRESHGQRARAALVYEDMDPLAVWRWELHSIAFYDKAGQAVIREIRAARGRTGRSIRAFAKVVEQVTKTPNDDAKISVFDERAAKAFAEVEKAKERRREVERKRAVEAELKLKKAEEKEVKRKEKEEAQLKKQAEAAAAAIAAVGTGGGGGAGEKKATTEKKAPTEKELKVAESLSKQKNLIMSFLKQAPKAGATSSSSSSSSSSAGRCSLGALITLDGADETVSSTVDDGAVREVGVAGVGASGSDVRVGRREQRSPRAVNMYGRVSSDFDTAAFDAALQAGLSMPEIIRTYKSK